MAQAAYTRGKQEIMTHGLFSSGTEDYELALLDQAAGYSFSASHEYANALTGYELSTTGYARQALPDLSIVTVGTNVGLEAGMVTYADIGAGPTWPVASAGVVIRKVTDDSDSWLLAYLDSITATTNGDDLIVTWDPRGVLFI